MVNAKSNVPKRHHFIPQMMLRHFTDAEGRLWFWRREFEKGDIRFTSTQNLFVQKDLYTVVLPNGEKDVALEKFFSLLEDVGVKFISDLAAIVRDGSVPDLDERAWQFWSDFFYYHLKRTPGFIEAFAAQMNLEGRVKKAVAKIEADLQASGTQQSDPDLALRIRRNAIVTAQRSPPSAEVREAFSKMGLAIYVNRDPKKSFIVGDVPGATVAFRLPDRSWSRPTLFLPLTWDICVGQLDRRKEVEVVGVEPDQVRRMNEASATRSTLFAGRSEQLIESLSRNAGYTGVLPIIEE
ncbi:DUF4238 domain-containing protein [Sphingopyxis sp. MWB1]|uniref:DUF4238 domain-containing protein n=1 Tax=Sphingopyxis sp. MWB1 TaxID=1537715 RepID=UPI000519F161|nr:DUF4238 domain-containing protein [Sphingopyxis sp. MWB1]